MALIAMPTLTRAADAITDPRAYCDHLAELLADGDIDTLTDSVVESSSKAVLEAEKRNAIARFVELPLKAGRLKTYEHISEWKAGEAFVSHSYVFIFEHTPFFLKCKMYRPDENWLISDFIGNSDPSKIGITR